MFARRLHFFPFVITDTCQGGRNSADEELRDMTEQRNAVLQYAFSLEAKLAGAGGPESE